MLKAKRAEPARPLPEAGLDSSFYIAVTSAPSRPRLTLKHNDVFVVLDSHGDIGATNNKSDGLFDCDTRFLSHLQLLLYGSRPLLLGSNVKDDNLHLDVDLTNPDIYFNDQIILLKDVIHVAKTIYVHDGNLRARIALTNHGDAPVELNLSLDYDNDFADLFEVRGLRRERRGHIEKQVVADTVLMTYGGIDGKIRETAISFEPRPTSLRPSVATYNLRLMPRAAQTILVLISCRGREQASVAPFLKGLASAHRERRTATRNVATIETSNALLNEVLCRSMADLYMLVSTTPQGPYPYAGIPWYSTTFGRDGLITAMQMLWFDPQIARGVLKRLAHYQADVFDAKSDAEPGKILHEMRGGEMAALGEVPFGRYYGSIDSTPLFVMLAGRYAARTGDYQLIEELWPAI
ncbi:MAG: amylo-alpha-1,6-glucosidase, partial [Burkholderiales bacterium]